MKKKKILSMILSVAVVFSFLVIPMTTEVNADLFGKVKYKKNIELTSLDLDDVFMYELDMGKLAKSSDKLSLKSSDTSVVWVESNEPYFGIKKIGKAKITIKNKTTKKKYTCTVTVINKNPFKSLKVGKKELKKQFNIGASGQFNISASKWKISITPKKGWKLKKIKYCTYKRGGSKIEKQTLKKKTVKNNSKITFKKDEETWGEYFLITMYDKKEKKSYEFRLQRGAF